MATPKPEISLRPQPKRQGDVGKMPWYIAPRTELPKPSIRDEVISNNTIEDDAYEGDYEVESDSDSVEENSFSPPELSANGEEVVAYDSEFNIEPEHFDESDDEEFLAYSDGIGTESVSDDIVYSSTVEFSPKKGDMKQFQVEGFASGGEKDIYSIKGKTDVLCIFERRLSNGTTLHKEARLLNSLRNKHHVSAVSYKELGVVIMNHKEKYAGIMAYYPHHSKEFVSMVRSEAKLKSFDEEEAKQAFTERSRDSLEAIKGQLKKAKIAVADLQFLIDRKGQFFISDPDRVLEFNEIGADKREVKGFHERNMDMINALMKLAGEYGNVNPVSETDATATEGEAEELTVGDLLDDIENRLSGAGNGKKRKKESQNKSFVLNRLNESGFSQGDIENHLDSSPDEYTQLKKYYGEIKAKLNLSLT